MAWIYIVIAGIFEVVWALGMKQTEGFTRLWPSVFTLGFMGISFYLLALGMRDLPAGTAYAVWTGIGAVGTVIFGIIWLGEPRDIPRLICVSMILGGVIGLKVFSPGEDAAEKKALAQTAPASPAQKSAEATAQNPAGKV